MNQSAQHAYSVEVGVPPQEVGQHPFTGYDAGFLGLAGIMLILTAVALRIVTKFSPKEPQ